MFKKMLILAAVIFFISPIIVSAEMAPQFKKSADDASNLSTVAPKHERLLKGGDAMENNATTGGEVMENNAATTGGEVMENNAAFEPGKVMENNAAIQPGKVMENNVAKEPGQVME